MYTTKNFKTKKDLTEQVKQWNFFVESLLHLRGLDVQFSKRHGEPLFVFPGNSTEKFKELFFDFAQRHQLDNPHVRAYANLAVTCFHPGLGSPSDLVSGTHSVEGPHAPLPHKWYARVTITNGIVTEVK